MQSNFPKIFILPYYFYLIYFFNLVISIVTARAKCLPINVVRKYGHTPEERIQNWMGQKLKCLLGDPNTTFSQVNKKQQCIGY